jgi:M6 family metalloprotease-like protein
LINACGGKMIKETKKHNSRFTFRIEKKLYLCTSFIKTVKMKKLLFTTLLSVALLSGYSAYLVNVPQTLKQPDGTVLHCFASGDEFYNYLHDSLGYTIVQDAAGYYVYALPAADGQIAPSNHRVGVANPVALGLPVQVSLSSELIMAKRADFDAMMAKDRLHKANGGNNKGTINNIVIFIRFSDESTYPSYLSLSTIQAMFNDSSSYSANSMYNFYRLASYGQLYIQSHFFPAPSGNTILSYQDIYPRSYYRPYNQTSNPNGYQSGQEYSRRTAMLIRAVNAIASSVPSTLDIDYDGDGKVDNVAFVVSGSPDGWSELLWPCRAWLSSQASIRGKFVDNFNFLLANTNGSSPWPGVLTHEMMHTLSAPDLYRYNDKTIDPVGSWDLMGSTNYSKAQGLGAHMKWKYGMWIPPLPDLAAPGTYTLYPANDATMFLDTTKPIGYRLDVPGFPNEYLVLEYRKTNTCTFENNLPGSGILIYRIRKNTNGNASGPPDEVYLFRPNGTQSVDGNLSAAHFVSPSRTNFDPNTNPKPFSGSGTAMTGFSITNITSAGDSIQFTYKPSWETLAASKEQINFIYQANNLDVISVSANVSWTMSGVDTSWLNVSITQGDSGITNNIQISTRSQNNLRVPRTCTLVLHYGKKKEKYVYVSQGIEDITTCQWVNNAIAEDTLAGYNFQQYGVNAVSEYFAATNNVQVIDSVSFYFGNISIDDNLDNTIKLEIYTSNASDRPGNTQLSQTLSAKDLKPNAWNTIVLQKPIVTNKGITVGYSFTRTDSNFMKINIYKNAALRTGNYSGTMLVRQGSWKKPFETTFSGIKNYSLAVKIFTCPPSPPTDYLTVDTTKLYISYDSNQQAAFKITSNTSWKIISLPEGYAASQTSGTGNANIVITTTSKHRDARKFFYFWVHSGSILHDMSIERATYPLISNKKEVVLNHEGTDSAVVMITATGTDWTSQTSCSWLQAPQNTGTAGNTPQRLVIYPAGANNTGAALEGCVDVVATSLNESMCVVVRQNPPDGIRPLQDASTLSLYPNPTTSQLTVNNGNLPIQTLIVYNVLGKEMLKISGLNSSYTELNVADWHAGVYFVKVISAKGVQVRKFVRN